MDQLLTQLCLIINLNYNLNQNACNSALIASYTNSEAEEAYKFGEKYFTNSTINYLGKETVYGGVLLGTGADAYFKKQLRLSTPLRPFIDQFSMDLTENNKSYSIGWKWDW